MASITGSSLLAQILDNLNAQISALQQNAYAARLQAALDAGTSSNFQIGAIIGANPQMLQSLPQGKTLPEVVSQARADIEEAFLVDTVPPQFVSARVDTDKLTLVYQDESGLDAQDMPSLGSFTLSGTEAHITGVVVDADSNLVQLTLSEAVNSSDTPLISYTDPTSADDKYAIQDQAGNDALSFAYEPVENLTQGWLEMANAFSTQLDVEDIYLGDSVSVTSLDSQTRWLDNNVTYSFNTSIPDEYYDANTSRDLTLGWTTLDTQERQIVRGILDQVSQYTLLDFTENATGGDLRFNMLDIQDSNTAGFAYYPGSSLLAGDVFLSSDLRDEDNLDPGDSGFQTFLHETGHALGLKHPFEGEFQLPSAQDNYAYSLMSYTSSRNYIPDFTYEPSTGSASYTAGMPEKSSAYHTQYSLFDIQTLQHIYGLNLSTKTGDDTYTLTFDDYAYMSIWDAEGIDTLDFSSTTFPSYIDLSGGTLSSIDVHDIDYQMQATIDQLHEQGANGLDDWVADIYSRDGAGFYTGENNLAIVAGTCMENLKTGSADDTVSDNLVDNYIETGAGDDRIMLYKGGFDIIDAGSGFDTVELNDPQTEVQIHSMDDGSILLLGTYFAASLFNVEQVVYLEGETVDFA